MLWKMKIPNTSFSNYDPPPWEGEEKVTLKTCVESDDKKQDDDHCQLLFIWNYWHFSDWEAMCNENLLSYNIYVI